jgi:CBS domain containing-hemolysin-like protein
VSPAVGLLVAAALILVNAFFVGAEFAVISARRSQVEPLVAAGLRGARRTLWAMQNVPLMLATAQLGITVASLGLGAVAEPALAHLLLPWFERVGLSTAVGEALTLVLALVVVVYCHVVVGEMIPKNLALAGPERAALWLAPPLVFVAQATSLVIRVLRAMTNGILRLLKVEPKEELVSAFTAEEVHSIVAESRREGLLDDDHGLLTGALELAHRSAGDVMVPWRRLATVTEGVSPADVERVVAHTGFSRFPVVAADRATVRDGADAGGGGDAGPVEVIGYLHIKDLLYADDERHTEPVPDKRVRALVSVAPEDELEDVLNAMQRSGSHLARVVDASARTRGVVFLEDVIEELVGEVSDATQRLEGPGRGATTRHPR